MDRYNDEDENQEGADCHADVVGVKTLVYVLAVPIGQPSDYRGRCSSS